jgi:hypothetical protein
MLQLRKSTERGYAEHGWLKSYHSFSFADYYDPNHVNFRSLRVINEDYIDPVTGFPTHGHQDMEIITYVLSGKLEHRDSLGSGSIIAHGDVQHMSAGTGISHSEFNPSKINPVHLLQIWIMPNQRGLTPSYKEQKVDLENASGKFQLMVTPDGRNQTIKVHQDMTLSVAILKKGEKFTHLLNSERYGWLQVAEGRLTLNDLPIASGDGIAIMKESELKIKAESDAEILFFDLA